MGILSKNFTGINVSDEFIEIVELTKNDKGFSVVGSAKIEITSALVKEGMVVDQEALGKLFKDALAKAKPGAMNFDKATCALPTAHTFVGSIELAAANKAAIEKALAKTIKDSVPLDYEDLVFSYTSIPQSKSKKTLVSYMASSKEVLKSWQDFFSSLSIEVVFDSRALAPYRALVKTERSGSLCLIDMSDAVVDVSVFEAGILRYSYGRHFEESESLVAEISKEVESSISSAGGADASTYKVVVLSSDINEEVLGAFAKELGREVKLAARPVRSKKASMTALGLALRDADDTWSKTDPSLSLSGALTLPREVVSPKSDDKDLRQELEEESRAKKLKKQKTMLIILLISGLIAAGAAYWFRANEKSEHQRKLEDLPSAELNTASSTPETEESSEGAEEAEGTTAEEDTAESAEDVLLILDTPTGWLNVRSGPGTEHDRVGRVEPGEVYEFTDKDGDWYEIEISATSTGWVFGQYVELE